MSSEDYEAWHETAYTLPSPANARRLLDAAEAVARGDVQAHDLDRA